MNSNQVHVIDFAPYVILYAMSVRIPEGGEMRFTRCGLARPSPTSLFFIFIIIKLV